MTVWLLFFDGANEPFNPKGIATYGYVLKKEGVLFKAGHGLATDPGTEKATNNMAEYAGLYKGLLAAKAATAPGDSIQVFGDSQLVIMQMKGEWAIKAPNLAKPSQLTKDLIKELEQNRQIYLEWIPREGNVEADQESKKAIREAIKKPEILKKITVPQGPWKHVGKTLDQVSAVELPSYFKRGM